MVFIGDVHGKVGPYEFLLRRFEEPTIQIGDMGVGFHTKGKWVSTDFLKDKDKWIHGNHDNPEKCEKEKGYLGRYGVTPEGVFFMSGAFSVDAFYRKPGIEWWFNEQLNIQELDSAFELYSKTKPDIVATHDCPRSLYPIMLEAIGNPNGPLFENVTCQALQKMFEVHKPKVWLYGHWHTSLDRVIDGTRFICLNELEPVTLEL